MGASMQTEIGALGGEGGGYLLPGRIDVTNGGASCTQNVERFLAEPFRATKFNCHPGRVGESLQGYAEARRVIRHIGGNLQQDHLEIFLEQITRAVEGLDVLIHIKQVFAMGNQAGSFQNVSETPGSALMPIVVGLVLECTVEGSIDF